MPNYVFLNIMQISQKLKSLLEGLFIKKPDLRLGSKSSSDVRNHPWFDTIDWNKLLTKEIKPHFVPVVKSELDTSHFDNEFTEMKPESHSAEGLLTGQQFNGIHLLI
jgi:serine/threonine protein kinase